MTPADPANDPTDAPGPAAAETPQAGDASGSKRRGGLLYKLALASVGGVMLAQEEISKVFRRGERSEGGQGDQAERQGEPSVPDEPSAEAQAFIEGTIDGTISGLSVPSRSEVDALAERIAQARARIAALKTR